MGLLVNRQFAVLTLWVYKISFRYKDEPVEKLKLYKLELTNDGNIDVKDFQVTLGMTLNIPAEMVDVAGIDSNLAI